MKILVDENVSPKLAKALGELGHIVERVADWRRAAQDEDIVARAADSGQIIVTLDRDIPAIALRRTDGRPSVIRLVRTPTARHLAAVLGALDRYGAELEAGAIVTVSPAVTRARRLTTTP